MKKLGLIESFAVGLVVGAPPFTGSKVIEWAEKKVFQAAERVMTQEAPAILSNLLENPNTQLNLSRGLLLRATLYTRLNSENRMLEVHGIMEGPLSFEGIINSTIGNIFLRLPSRHYTVTADEQGKPKVSLDLERS